MVMLCMYIINNVFFKIINAGTGLAAGWLTGCTKEHQCGLYQGDCTTDSQCQGNLKCGIKNCKLTSNITNYAGHWQEFNCCYNGISIRKKNVDSSITILLFFCLEQRSLSCHVPNLDDLTVKKCEQADSPCMVKRIGKSILSHFPRVLCME